MDSEGSEFFCVLCAGTFGKRQSRNDQRGYHKLPYVGECFLFEKKE